MNSKILFFIMSLFFLGFSITSQAKAQSDCHDGSWDSGEFCGRDAWLVTGAPEMNHDCILDILDLPLFVQDWALTGSNLSGDINGDNIVDIMDLFYFVSPYGGSVSPCTPGGMLPDQCEGTIALSFNSDPETIVSTQTQTPGADRVYVVIDGWTNPGVLEYAVEASSNIQIIDHQTGYPYWPQGEALLFCDPDPQHSYRGYIRIGGDWPTGPITYGHLDYLLMDSDPAWFKLVPVPACFNNSRIRWAKYAANCSYDFETVLNAGINGPAPPGESTCSAPIPIPTLSEWGIIIFMMVMLGIGVVILRKRRTA